MPRVINVAYTDFPFEDPRTGELKEVSRPLLSVFLVANHRVGRSISALVDSGSDFNIFPAQYAEIYFAMKEKNIKKGIGLEIVGIGQSKIAGYRHFVTIQHPEFRLENIPVYFSYDHQNIPLLGRSGFFTQFRRVGFYQNEKRFELELP